LIRCISCFGSESITSRYGSVSGSDPAKIFGSTTLAEPTLSFKLIPVPVCRPIQMQENYFHNGFSICRLDKIPSFLHKYADTILRTGKYLNVIQQCDKSAQWAAIQPLEYLSNSEHYQPIIDKVRSVTGNRIWVYWYRYFLKPFLCRVVDPD
jgi:hypothetical protein